MGTFFRVIKLHLTFALVLIFSTEAHAHQWEQIYIQHEIQDGQHVFNMEFDVGYAIPDTRDDPNAEPPSSSWLLEQDSLSYQKIRTEAQLVLLSFLHFSEGSKPISPRISFPDWDQQPPTFPKNLNGFAYISVQLTLPATQQQNKLIVRESAYATNVLLETAQFGLLTLPPGDDIALPLLASPSSIPASSRLASSLHNTKVGFLHVIPEGLDHVLFILAMCLSAGGLRKAISYSLVFTFCHMLSFALIFFQLIELSGFATQLAEWGILGSIIVLSAIQLLKKQVKEIALLPLIISFSLLHGLGFASTLLENIPSHHTLGLICAIGLGIELAQLTIVLLTSMALYYLKKYTKERQLHITLHCIIIFSVIIILFQN